MFLINKKLETEIGINGKIYQINMTFNNIMDFLEIMDNQNISDIEKIHFGLHQLLGEIPELEPADLLKVFDEIIVNFIQEEKIEVPVDLAGNPMPVKKEKPVQDLKHDAPYIFVSFKEAYGIDLIEEQDKLDWRLFKIYLRELPDDSRLKQIIQIRVQKLPSGKHATKERERLAKLKRIYALPDGE